MLLSRVNVITATRHEDVFQYTHPCALRSTPLGQLCDNVPLRKTDLYISSLKRRHTSVATGDTHLSPGNCKKVDNIKDTQYCQTTTTIIMVKHTPTRVRECTHAYIHTQLFYYLYITFSHRFIKEQYQQWPMSTMCQFRGLLTRETGGKD